MNIKDLFEALNEAFTNYREGKDCEVIVKAPFAEYKIKDCYFVAPLVQTDTTLKRPAIVLEAVNIKGNEENKGVQSWKEIGI